MTYPRRAFMRAGAAVLAPAPSGYGTPDMPAAAPGPSAGILRARLVIISGPNGGLFVYSGAPALGNPPIFWATSASVDPFGNVISSTAGVGAGGTFSVNGTETVTGTLNVSGALNVTGSATITNPGKLTAGNIILTTSGLVGYSGAPAANNAIFSEAPAQFTDAFGNVILAGTTTYGVSGITYYALNQLPGIDRPGTFGAVMSVYTATSMAGPWTVGGQINLSGSSHIEITGDVTHLFGATGQPTFILHNSTGLLSASSTLTATAAGALSISNNANYAANAVVSTLDTTTNTNANGAGATRISAIWSIPAGDMNVGTEYELVVPFSATMEGQTLQLGLSVDGSSTFTGSDTIGAAIVGAGVSILGSIGVRVIITAAGAAGTYDTFVYGYTGQAATNALFTNRGALVGQSLANTIDTTAAHTLRVNSLWGAAAAGQTVSGVTTRETRRGT